jgi:hypothetical protein
VWKKVTLFSQAQFFAPQQDQHWIRNHHLPLDETRKLRHKPNGRATLRLAMMRFLSIEAVRN